MAGVPLCFLFSILDRIVSVFRGGRVKKPDTTNTLFVELSEMGSAIIVDPAMRKLKKEAGANLFFVIFKDNVKSLEILHTVPKENIFLMRPEEIRWFYQDGVNWIYPDAFAELQKPIPPAERGDIVAAYHKRLTHPDRKVQIEAARAWSIYEASTMSLKPDADRLRMCAADSYALAFARIECHYFVNGGFLKRKDQLLAEAGPLHRIPGTIVHGRYDVVTPLKNAFDLKAVWSEADLRIVPAAGHAMTEPAIMEELVAATRRYSGRAA